MLISGISRAYNNHFNPDQIAQDLNSGKYYLVSFGNCHAPLLRKVARVNDAQQDEKTKAEWEFTTNTLSESLTSDLKFLMGRVEKPAFVSATIRQEAKPDNTSKASSGQQAKKETYWVELKAHYEGSEDDTVNGMPYIVTFSDSTKREGYLNGGEARINNIPAGPVTVEFGYPEAEQGLKQARKELKNALDDIIKALEDRAKPLDMALQEEGVSTQALILSGAFFSGLYGAAGSTVEGIKKMAKDMAKTARVMLNDWEGVSDKLKLETIEYIESKEATYLEFIAEVDEKRSSVEEALNKGVKQVKADLEELASYADKGFDNAYAYGETSIAKLGEAYNRYALLLEDPEVGKMLKEFPGRYYDAMPKVEAAQACGGLGFNVLVAVLTGAVGSGAAISGFVTSKLPLFDKTKDLVDEILRLLDQKTKTPAAKVQGQNNQEVKTAVPKVEKKAVEEKEKKKCSVCDKAYNAKCPNANPKINYPSETKGSGGDLTDYIVANPDNNYERIEDHPWFFTRTQVDKNGRESEKSSLQAHHIIVSETMKNDDLKSLCDDFGYNINHFNNGVMLPYYMDLACHLGVPVHRGGHSAGMGELKLNYPRSVERKLEALEEAVADGDVCGSSRVDKQFKKEMDKISRGIFEKIKNFDWTISKDGADYDFRKSKVGCGNQGNINDKDGSLCRTRSQSSDSVHVFPEANAKIDQRQRLRLKIGC
jgi:hypothetical protein